MNVETLSYEERVFFVYKQSMSMGQNDSGYVRPMCMEEAQPFASEEALFDQVYIYLNSFMVNSHEGQVYNQLESHGRFMQEAHRFYVIEVYFSKEHSLQGFIRGREYPKRAVFRNKETFCSLMSVNECAYKKMSKNG